MGLIQLVRIAADVARRMVLAVMLGLGVALLCQLFITAWPLAIVFTLFIMVGLWKDSRKEDRWSDEP